MDISSITAAIASIKTAKEIITGLNKLKSEVEINSAKSELLNQIIDIQSNLLTIQSEYQSIFEENNDLKERLKVVNDWETEKENYCLKSIPNNNFAYSLKNPQTDTEKKLLFCPNCFSNQQIKILQYTSIPQGYICNSCDSFIDA